MQRQSLQHRRLLPRRQHPLDPERDQRLERRERIGRHVEGTMERHRKRAGAGDQRLGPRFVDHAVGVQQADHDAVGALGLRRLDVRLHDREFVVVEQKIAAARPDDDVHANAGDSPRLPHHAAARRGAALHQVGAQLYTVRASFLRGAHARHRIHADLEDHRSPPLALRPA